MKQKNISKLLSADEFYFPILNHCALAIWSNKRKKKLSKDRKQLKIILFYAQPFFITTISKISDGLNIYPKLGFFWFGNHPIWPKYVRM